MRLGSVTLYSGEGVRLEGFLSSHFAFESDRSF